MLSDEELIQSMMKVMVHDEQVDAALKLIFKDLNSLHPFP